MPTAFMNNCVIIRAPISSVSIALSEIIERFWIDEVGKVSQFGAGERLDRLLGINLDAHVADSVRQDLPTQCFGPPVIQLNNRERLSRSSLRIGFLVWNQFQVAHFAEIAKQFNEPDFIFTDRDARALDGFDPSWLVPYGGYCRFLSDTSLHTLDGQYDVIVAQHRPPLQTPWRKTRLVMYQYSLAKPKTAYNSRWFAADLGMVYGRFSESIIGRMCATSRVGNARFDPYFEGRLDPRIQQLFRDRLDPAKATILYLPTWGDLNALSRFEPALKELANDFNVILRQHHLTSLRDEPPPETGGQEFLHAGDFPPILDPGVYLLALADIVISDMSGAIFDALYCRKPVVLLGGENDGFSGHRKADDTAIEIRRRAEIGPFVSDTEALLGAVRQIMDFPSDYSSSNERLVKECFERRGGCAALAAGAIEIAVEGAVSQPLLKRYAAPDFANSLLARAASAARKRNAARTRRNPRSADLGPRLALFRKLQSVSKRTGLAAMCARGVIRSTRYTLRLIARSLDRIGRPEAAAALQMICVRELGDRKLSAIWLASHVERRGYDALAEALYERAKSLSPTARSQYLRLLLKRRAFFAAGLEVERWLRSKQRLRARTLYQTYNATSALRFSRVVWKSGIARLFRTNFSPSTAAGTEVLARFGMIRTAEAIRVNRGKEVPTNLRRLLDSLGEFGDVLDVAAKNEASTPQWQMCITPRGELTRVSDVPADSVAEVYLLLSLSREIKEDEERAYKGSLLGFSENVVHVLRQLGVNVYPRIQAGIIGATPVTPRYPAAFTWHTLACGLKGQLHLKIGSLFGYFIIDEEGYSGWSAIAEEPLWRLTEDVDELEAESHWRLLHNELVAGGKSKYAQGSEKPANFGRYVFFPMQVLDDTVSQLADINTLELLRVLSEWGASSDLKVVVKRHPMCRNEDIARTIEAGRRAGAIQVSDANIHHLIENAECVITVNSGVGAEALLHLKPVITTGGSDYAAATRRVRSVPELREVLDSRNWRAVSEDEIKRFLWYFTHRYMVRYNDKESLAQRLQHLLQRTPLVLGPAQQPGAVTPATEVIPFVSVSPPPASVGPVRDQASVNLGEQCETLLKEFKSRGVNCWLDSGSLLGLVRNGHLNHWEKDIDLGIWVDDLEAARDVCRRMVERFDLEYREKWVKSIPYALLLNGKSAKPLSVLPIAVHVFYRKGDCAWSIQPHSLVAAHSKYPKYVYREIIGNRRGRRREKLKFAAKYPKYAMSIVIDGLNLNRAIGRRLRDIERERSLAEKILMKVFNEMFEWTIPARYFDELAPLSEAYPHLLIPAATDEYLRARYGDWRVAVQDWFYVVDDGCIRPLPARVLNQLLNQILAQVPRNNPEFNAN